MGGMGADEPLHFGGGAARGVDQRLGRRLRPDLDEWTELDRVPEVTEAAREDRQDRRPCGASELEGAAGDAPRRAEELDGQRAHGVGRAIDLTAENTAAVLELNFGPYIAFLLKLYLYEFSDRIDASL